MPEFVNLPHRANIAGIARTGPALLAEVMRQFAIQDTIGEEVGAAVNGDKTIEQASSGAESCINEVLADI